MIRIPPDFKEFLRLLNSKRVEYLLIGGYAVGYHGYPRENAERLDGALREFGFDLPELSPELFLQEERVIRMGVPPFRVEAGM